MNNVSPWCFSGQALPPVALSSHPSPYTAEPCPPQPPLLSAGAIAGIVVGGVIVVAAGTAAVIVAGTQKCKSGTV